MNADELKSFLKEADSHLQKEIGLDDNTRYAKTLLNIANKLFSLKVNRAGPNEAPLSIANIRKAFCDRIPIRVWNDRRRYEFNVNTGGWVQILDE